MKNRKFSFLKCCEWLYQGAVSVGILFVLYGFWQGKPAGTDVFSGTEEILKIAAAGTFFAQLLIIWSGEKGYQIRVGLGLLSANILVGMYFVRYTEHIEAFWGYAAMEAVCFMAAVMIYAIRRSLVLKGLVIFAQAAALIALAFLEKPFPIWCEGIMLTAFLLFLVEAGAKDRKEVLGLLPFFAAAMLFLGMNQENEKPMDWSWAKNLLQNTTAFIQEKVEMLMVDISYMLEDENEFSFSGYAGDARLGGSVYDNERVQLYVSGNATKNPLYLTGRVYQIYTGESWQAVPQSVKEEKQANIQDALEQSIYAKEWEDLISPCQISVEYRLIKTTDFFHELNTTDVHGDSLPLKKDEPWTMNKPGRKGFNYQLDFMEINENSEKIKALYRQQAWKEPLAEEEKLSEVYTKLPECVPQRVYELAHVIAADEQNDYDCMRAFSEYLKDYTYTQTPPAASDGQEFTDYFLFDSKSGYCSYFATAIAVLGRCEGIPTRYVQGFLTADICRGTWASTEIASTQAHAWTEFYIAHIGWVRIDATPGYGENLANRWVSKKEEEEKKEQKFHPDVLPGKPTPPVSKEKPTEAPALPEKLNEDFDPQNPIALKIIAGLLAGVLFAVIVLSIRNLVRRRSYRRSSDLKKLQIQLKILLRLGRLYKVALAEGEVLQEYQERVREVLDTKAYSFARVCTVYEGIRFGGKSISQEELREMENYVKEAEHCYLADCGFLKRVVYYVV